VPRGGRQRRERREQVAREVGKQPPLARQQELGACATTSAPPAAHAGRDRAGCHFFGRRRFDTDDHSTNVAWLAIPSLGEAWHHNHHAFPTSAFHGLRRLEVDPSGLLIRLLERVGLAWDVVRVPPERQAAKAQAAVSAQQAAAG
jgi:hypothetical protein